MAFPAGRFGTGAFELTRVGFEVDATAWNMSSFDQKGHSPSSILPYPLMPRRHISSPRPRPDSTCLPGTEAREGFAQPHTWCSVTAGRHWCESVARANQGRRDKGSAWTTRGDLVPRPQGKARSRGARSRWKAAEAEAQAAQLCDWLGGSACRRATGQGSAHRDTCRRSSDPEELPGTSSGRLGGRGATAAGARGGSSVGKGSQLERTLRNEVSGCAAAAGGDNSECGGMYHGLLVMLSRDNEPPKPSPSSLPLQRHQLQRLPAWISQLPLFIPPAHMVVIRDA